MNNKYTIRITHPLVRPGLTIETEASEKYVGKVIAKAMTLIREINAENDNAKTSEPDLIKAIRESPGRGETSTNFVKG